MFVWAVPNLLVAMYALYAIRNLGTAATSAALDGTLSYYLDRREPMAGKPAQVIPGAAALQLIYLCLIAWAGFQFLASIVPGERMTHLFTQLAYIGIALSPAGWFLFAYAVGRRVVRVPRSLAIAVSAIPLVTLVLVLTNPMHQWFWSSWDIVTIDLVSKLDTQKGPWFSIHTVYAYALVLIATTILVFSLTTSRQHKRAALAAIGAPITAVGINGLFVSPLNPNPGLDYSVIAFAAAVAILDRWIVRKGLFQSFSVIRDRVVEELDDAVLVVTRSLTIIDSNMAARRLLSPNSNSLVGRKLADILGRSNDSASLFGATNPEVTIGARAFELSLTKLQSGLSGSDYSIVFRDITKRQAAEHALLTAKRDLERQAQTDPLTELRNRRTLMEELTSNIAGTRKSNGAFSLLLIDLDHFKRVNDTYGHDCGDTVLIRVASVLNRIARSTDIVYRIGGEEFAMLLPDTDEEGAVQCAERLQTALRSEMFEPIGSAPFSVSASVGVATTVDCAPTAARVFRAADQALYRAKNAGRDRVRVSPIAALQAS